ncbi:hypothetical protein N8I74_12840 [Chitiniphilus purpureus]|uniref:Helix-turn-helix domain-containing protein n=1 Tax=Chitiniphilus purpureus TaxID=2981137 RepID=A0ABY6DIP8_9NEIS|nr:hypothetical protein [Chitiniphilus sp. CD1]UXY14202.1 hypothetical protein N8I74_12840 [Chitiniphilus sp. CD1]
MKSVKAALIVGLQHRRLLIEFISMHSFVSAAAISRVLAHTGLPRRF